ncbi:MAG: hypothetical protein J6S14_11580 [Clostridia bacterium]|nr:hypothetical protein [Clostridia bacterium]
MTNETMLPEEMDEAMLPDGWSEDDDIFSPDTWGDSEADAQTEELEEQDEAENLTTDDGESDDKTETEETPTTEQNEDDLSFIARVDHRDVDVKLSRKDLPALYQKAQVTDRLQQRMKERDEEARQMDELARILDYKDRHDMRTSILENWKKNEVDRLVSEGVNEEVASETVESRVSRKRSAAAELPNESTDDGTPTEGTRDFRAEVANLYALYPDVAKSGIIPDAVKIDALTNGTPLAEAYAKHIASKQTAEAAALKKENKILKQNAASAARAPVKGVRGGGTVSGDSRDAFDKNLIAGFDEEY